VRLLRYTDVSECAVESAHALALTAVWPLSPSRFPAGRVSKYKKAKVHDLYDRKNDKVKDDAPILRGGKDGYGEDVGIERLHRKKDRKQQKKKRLMLPAEFLAPELQDPHIMAQVVAGMNTVGAKAEKNHEIVGRLAGESFRAFQKRMRR
jgi:hypothetical protein